MPKLKVQVISAHPLWLEALQIILRNFKRPVEVTTAVTDFYGLYFESKLVEFFKPDLIIVSLNSPVGDLNLIRNLRKAGYEIPIFNIGSPYALPSYEELESCNVQGIVSGSANLEVLEAAVNAIVDKKPNTLENQYREATRIPHVVVPPLELSEKDRIILQLAASDLSDREIGERLDLSTHTVSSHLRRLYAKIGAKTRTGAVAKGLAYGLIQPDPSLVTPPSGEI